MENKIVLEFLRAKYNMSLDRRFLLKGIKKVIEDPGLLLEHMEMMQEKAKAVNHDDGLYKELRDLTDVFRTYDKYLYTEMYRVLIREWEQVKNWAETYYIIFDLVKLEDDAEDIRTSLLQALLALVRTGEPFEG